MIIINIARKVARHKNIKFKVKRKKKEKERKKKEKRFETLLAKLEILNKR